MAKVLVTGATGFVGSALVRALLKHGDDVHVLVRPNSRSLTNIEGLPLTLHQGDVLDPASLDRAMQGIDVVYHAAATYQFFPWWKRLAKDIYKVNIAGTRNMIHAAKRAKVRRFVFTSSIVTIGVDGGGVSNETTPFDKRQLSSHYMRSKFESEAFVLKEARKGFPAVVVNPGIVMGERDSRPTPSGEIVVKFLNRWYPGYFNTMLCLADVDDVARGHIQAAEKGRLGERYILCTPQHCSMKEFFKMLQKVSGVRAPFINFPYPLLSVFILFDELTCRWISHKPLLPRQGVRFCRSFARCDISKATEELGFCTTPLEQTLRKAVKWYKENGYVRN